MLACCTDDTAELIQAEHVREHVYLDVQTPTDLNTNVVFTHVCLPALYTYENRSQLVQALPFMSALPGSPGFSASTQANTKARLTG